LKFQYQVIINLTSYSNNQEPASRLLITGLIIRSKLNNRPTLVFTMLLIRGLVEEPGWTSTSLFLPAINHQNAKNKNKNFKIWVILEVFWLKICTLFLVYSQIWLNLPKNDCHFFYIFQWMIATLATNKNSW